MSLRVMLLLGVLVLILGCQKSWLAPMTTSQPRSLTSIGTTTVSMEVLLLPPEGHLVRKSIYRRGKR